MFKSKKLYINSEMIMSDLIFENPSLLLLLEHFDINFIIQDKTIAQICEKKKVSKLVYTTLCNLYNGFNPLEIEKFNISDIPIIISFLKNTHIFYKNEKYPEIKGFIKELYKNNKSELINLIEKFFNEYFDEVIEHLDYEDKVAFPYFCKVLSNNNDLIHNFSVKEYREHHSDIEYKLSELKNLLLKYLPLKFDRKLKRRLFFSLQELEFDLKIHSKIEELILVPLIERIENKN